MNDLIKRSDAIKAIEELPTAYNGWSDAYEKAYIIGALEEVPKADRPQGEWIDDIISRLESMAEDMRAMDDVEKAMGVDSALWLIEAMKGADDE